MQPDDSPVPSATPRHAAAGAGDVILLRSRLEIAAVLQSLVERRANVWAYLGEAQRIFISRLLAVDVEHGRIVLAYGAQEAANRALLEQPEALLRSTAGIAYVEFHCDRPQAVPAGDAPGIALDFPTALVRSGHRRYTRLRVPAAVPLRCHADAGGALSFDAKVLDIGRGGLGTLSCDPGVRLVPGAVLRGCRIFHPRGTPMLADLEVRNVKLVAQPDGLFYQRVGFRFLQFPASFEEFLGLYVTRLTGTEIPTS